MRAASLGLLLSALAAAAAAHPEDESGVQVGVLSAVRIERAPEAATFDAEVALYLRNPSGEPATLRLIRAPGADRARLLETVRLFGVTAERELRFLRLDPGEARSLEPPDARVLVEGVRADALAFGGFVLRLDFGPRGIVEVLARPRPPTAQNTPAAPSAK